MHCFRVEWGFGGVLLVPAGCCSHCPLLATSGLGSTRGGKSAHVQHCLEYREMGQRVMYESNHQTQMAHVLDSIGAVAVYL